MNWLQKFFYGRHGVDQFTLFLIFTALVLNCVAIFMPVYAASLVLQLLSWACLLYGLFRMLSRKHDKRVAENEAFRLAVKPVTAFASTLRLRWRDRKVCRYYRCPQCHATLRVPRGKGKIEITCPACKHSFIKKT